MKKQDLYQKLSETDKKLKEIGFSNEEIAFLKTKVSKHNLGLYLSYTEFDKELQENYFGFKEIEELGINVKSDLKNHLLIEGDNYYALKALKTSNVKADVIYIDPPYNTGKEFVYNDNFANGPKPVGADDPHKHSKWLSFMKKRLELAKELLSEGGVIFVSIDDNEQAYLKVQMDEIFGEDNFVANFVWLKGNAQNDALNAQKNHEYIVSYLKKQGEIFKRSEKITEDRLFDEIGEYYIGASLLTGGAGGVLNARPNLGTSIYFNLKKNDFVFLNDYNLEMAKISNDENLVYQKPNSELTDNGYICIRPPKKMGKLGRWTWDINKFNSESIVIVGSTPRKKIYINENTEKEYKNLKSFFEISSSAGTIELNKIFGKKVFDSPKPINLLKNLLNSFINENAIVLDFFAGSGTTAQAVMELNAKDGGDRRFILVTNNEMNGVDTKANPEKGIARAITRERLFRVINQKGSKGEEIAWKHEKHDIIKQNSVKYLQVKQIHKVNGEFEEIDEVSKISEIEFDKKLSIADFE